MNNNKQQKSPQWKIVDPVQATLLYTHVRRDAISLANTKVVVAASGKILANIQNTKRINVVKELIDTWYTLSRTLINTASIGRLKPEFCQALYNLLDTGTKKFQERSFTKPQDVTTSEHKVQNKTTVEQNVASTDFFEQLLQKVEDQSNQFDQAQSVQVAPINVQSPILNNSLQSNNSCSPIYTETQRVQLAELTLENKKLALKMKKIKMRSFESESELKLAKLENEINALRAKSTHDMMKAKETHISSIKTQMKLSEQLTETMKAQKNINENRVVIKEEQFYDEDSNGNKYFAGYIDVERKAEVDKLQEDLNHKKIKILKQLEQTSDLPIIFETNYQSNRQKNQSISYNQEGRSLPLTQQIEVGSILALEDNQLDNYDSRSFQSRSNVSNSNYGYKDKKRSTQKRNQTANSMMSTRSVKSRQSIDEDGFVI